MTTYQLRYSLTAGDDPGNIIIEDIESESIDNVTNMFKTAKELAQIDIPFKERDIYNIRSVMPK